MNRWIKILLSLSVALLCLFYGLQNLANLDQALGAVAYVIGNVDHAVYPETFGPTLTAPWAAKLGLAVILLGEFSAGLMALKGSWDLFQTRHGDGDTFSAAKRWSVAACGVAMLTWFGLFHAIGGALFQQWQTQAGDQSLAGAAWYAGLIGIIALYISLTDD